MRKSKIYSGDALARTKLKIEQAKLVKLEATLPQEEPEYTRYEDLPPLTPTDTLNFHNKFMRMARSTEAQIEGRKLQEAEDNWHYMNNWMKGYRVSIPEEPKPSLPFWEGITIAGRSIFDGDRLCQELIDAVFGNAETRAADVKQFHENNARRGLGHF